MNYKCVIFDCDGVLVDTETTTMKLLLTIAKEAGLDLSLQTALDKFAGQSIQYCFDYINQNSSKNLPDNIEEIFRKRAFLAYQRDIKAIPNVAVLLEQIKVPCCVASNGPLPKITTNLESTGLIGYFDNNIFSAYQIKKWKPLPDLFLYAAQKMGFQAQDCVVIEDSLAGVQAAIAGGFDVFAYANKGTALELKKAGATIFYDMNELYQLL